MTRKILINGRREEEVRVAIVDNQTLEDFEIETKNSGLLRNNIYRGIVSNIAPSLNAAFIDFGDVKNGFLAFNDVVESVYHKPVKDAQRISDVLVVGQPLIVQVIKDATGLKGAQVTTNISLAGRYLVLRPKDAKSGVSRKVDEDARADLTQKARSLDLPDGYGCIVRTNAMDQSRAILLRDAKVLIQLWHKIEAEYAKTTGPALLYNDQDIVVQAMRDYFDSTIHEVLIDNRSCYERALAYIHATVDGGGERIKYYDDRTPLFTRYNIERQINQIYARTVSLPSGGFIVIDPTEALTAIDVNSARATKRDSQDLTAYHTNLEAAAEIARQLRMRDIGGLIVIDFIDMKSSKYQRDVERAMRTAMARDKARNKCERISANGLLEINRQRLSQALSMRTHLECPTCGGRGFIPTIEALGLNLIREIEARAVQGTIAGAIISLSPENAQTVQNARRHDIAQLEEDYHLHIEICAVREMSLGDESIQWLTKEEVAALHPGLTPHTTPCAVDVSSLVEVTEAYNAQSPIMDDSYRPNDFEEFSNDEARKRRASRRAKREHTHAATVPDMSHTAQDNAKVQVSADTSVTQKRVGLAILTSLIRAASPHLEERGNAPRRRMNIRSHRRPHREDGGIKMDTCLFALDLIRAICTIDGVEGEMTRKQLIANAERVIGWLSRALSSPEEVMSSRCAALIAQTTSRHARARLEVLFSGTEPASSDALGIALCTERDIVLHKHDDTSSRKALHAIETAIAKRISEVFGTAQPATSAPTSTDSKGETLIKDSKEAKDSKASAMSKASVFEEETILPPATFDTSELVGHATEEETLSKSRRQRHTRRGGISDAVSMSSKMTPENRTAALVTPSQPQTACASQPNIDENTESIGHAGTRRRRHASRRHINELSLIRDNNAVVCSEMEVPSMTVIKDEEEETDIAQAITQELPAVQHTDGTSSQRSRHERRSRRSGRLNMGATDVAPIAEAITAEDTQNVDLAIPSERRERRERRRERIGQEASASAFSKAIMPGTSDRHDDAIAHAIEKVVEELTYSPAAEIESIAYASEMLTAAVPARQRVRKTRRGSITTPVVDSTPTVAPVEEQKGRPLSEEPSHVSETVETTHSERRPRKSRSKDKRERSATPTPPAVQDDVATPISASVEPPQASDSSSQATADNAPRRETRQVRKTKARRAKVDANVPDQDVMQATAAQTADDTHAVSLAETEEATQRSTARRVRRSRRAMSSDTADDNTIQTQANMTSGEGESIHDMTPSETDSATDRRIRKTRRSRIDDTSATH